MNFDDATSALKAGDFEIDCTEMVLGQNRKHSPISYTGKGYIRQDASGFLTFKIYATEFLNDSPRGNLLSTLSVQSGKLFAPDDYYRLEAKDRTGTVWFAEQVLRKCDWNSGAQPIVTGGLSRIATNERMERRGHHLELIFFEDLSVPFPIMSVTTTPEKRMHHRDTAEFSAHNVDFVVRQRDERELRVTANSLSSFPKEFNTRIQEALQCIAAKTLPWRAFMKAEDGEVRIELASPTSRSEKPKIQPPIGGRADLSAETWQLFSLYLEYVVKNAVHDYWNNCSYHLHNAYEASANSLDAWAVGLSVAVEGISNLIPQSPSRNEDKEEVKALVRFILDHVNTDATFSKFGKRVCKRLAIMNSERPEDRLLPLVATGHLMQEGVDAWRKLRNMHVHPAVLQSKKFNDVYVQSLIDRLHKTETLMHQLVFYLVGYSGRYSDYGTHKWPIRVYPRLPTDQ